MPKEIWTIGHWTCPQDAFLGALAPAGIDLVADVRAQPGSRRSPQFSTDRMPEWLGAAGIGYLHLPALGGRRPKNRDVDPLVNAGWENASFKNYADYTLTPQFEEGLRQLVALAGEHRVALLCGEPMPWRCHRSLIANVLTARGWQVHHLRVGAAPQLHEVGKWGASPVVHPDGVLTYPPHQEADDE